MRLYELANRYHAGTDLGCAEAMFRACEEYYGLHLTEETRKMFSIMGTGMQTEHSCCGVFTVAVGIIGLMTARNGQLDSDNLTGYRLVCELTNAFLDRFGTLTCGELQRLELEDGGFPCRVVTEEVARKLEELLPSGSVEVRRRPEEIPWAGN